MTKIMVFSEANKPARLLTTLAGLLFVLVALFAAQCGFALASTNGGTVEEVQVEEAGCNCDEVESLSDYHGHTTKQYTKSIVDADDHVDDALVANSAGFSFAPVTNYYRFYSGPPPIVIGSVWPTQLARSHL